MSDDDFPDEDDDGADFGEPEDQAGELDGVVDTSATVQCPYCGETCEIALDPSGGSVQHYVEDCQVCCQPWNVVVTFHATGQADVYLERGDG